MARVDLPVHAGTQDHGQDVSFSTRGYLDVLSTYSGHRALTSAQRQGLCACIGDLIDRPHGGVVSKRHLYELRVANLNPVL